MSDAQHENWADWRWQLRHASRSIDDLVRGGWLLDSNELNRQKVVKVAHQFKTLITPYYLSLIDSSDPECPIRLQAIPHPSELDEIEGERGDPIGDKAHSPTPILVHRYPDRALLFPTYECPMFCRYCFRKEALNDQPIRLHQSLKESLAYLSAHPQIKEVILSGGDPLMLSTERLSSLLQALLSTPVERIRIHSRTPVTLPQRIDEGLCQALSTIAISKPITLITHFNHPRELSSSAAQALRGLKSAGVILLNQSVLLKGVNNRAETLRDLSYTLGRHGVIPYYLHHTDLTKGTQHFRCSIDEGLKLYRSFRGQISGYLIPRYVIEIPGGGGKIELNSKAVIKGELEGEWWFKSPLSEEKFQYFDLAIKARIDDR